MNSLSFSFTALKSLRHTWRTLQISSFNASHIVSPPSPSLLDLPDEILLLILSYVEQKPEYDPMVTCWHGQESYRREDFVHLTMANRRLRDLAAKELFKTVTLGRSWSAKRVIKGLEALRLSDHAKLYVRELRVDIWYDPGAKAKRKQLLRVGALLASTIPDLTKLRRFTLATPINATHDLEDAFQRAEVEFRGVKELKLNLGQEWIVQWFPDVEGIETDDWLEDERTYWGNSSVVHRRGEASTFVEVAGLAPKLKYFSLHARWKVDLLEEVLQAMPGLRGLTMAGGRYQGEVDGYLEVLKKFPHLRRLALIDAHHLQGLRYEGDHERLIAFRDVYHAHGEEWERSVHMRKEHQAATTQVLRALPGLTGLSIGKAVQVKVLERNTNGATVVQYGWTLPSSKWEWYEELRILGDELPMFGESYQECDAVGLMSDVEDSRSMFSCTGTLAL